MNKEPFYKLITINELSTIDKNSPIQIAGAIENIGDDKTLIINDQSGNVSLSIKEGTTDYRTNEIVRIFGKWDGITILVEKILKWKIPKEKLELLYL